MALIKKPSVFTPDRSVQDLQISVRRALQQLNDVPFLDGALLEDLLVTTTATDFAHGLQRKFRGYIVLSTTANSIVRNPAASVDDTKFIRFQTSTNTTASVWVF